MRGWNGLDMDLEATMVVDRRRVVLRVANQGVGGTVELRTAVELRRKRAVVK